MVLGKNLRTMRAHFSAVGVEATLRHVCHAGATLEVVCEALEQDEGLLRALVPNLRGTERSDIVVNLHCGLRQQRGFSPGVESGEALLKLGSVSVGSASVIPPKTQKSRILAQHRLSQSCV